MRRKEKSGQLKTVKIIKFTFIVAVCLFMVNFITGCRGCVKKTPVAVEMISPEKTMEACIDSIKSADKKTLANISLMHYVKSLDDIKAESKEIQKAYYTDCIAQEFKYERGSFRRFYLLGSSML